MCGGGSGFAHRVGMELNTRHYPACVLFLLFVMGVNRKCDVLLIAL